MSAKHYQVLIIYIYTAYISLAFNKYVNVRSQYLTDRMLYRVHLAMSEFELTTSVVIGSDYTGSCKSKYIFLYHTITTTTASRMQCSSYYTLSPQL
jgi:hypothetical protein